MPAEPFEIHVPEEVLSDLGERLSRTRWPDEIRDAGWDYGIPLSYLRDLAEYWRSEFDWRRQERLLNAFRHFRLRVDGLDLHFIHERGRGPRPLPIVLTHGWPSSFFEMTKLIPLLTDPASHGGDADDAFDVVVPSLPGCGFSERPTERGMTKTRIAALWAKLMTEGLGYERFAARGGDIGSGVTAWLGLDYPERVVGINVSDVLRPFVGPGSRPLTPAESRFLEEERLWMESEGAYDHIQATKPQTLAYGLTDSPAGLAAWILEKHRAWSDCDGAVEKRFTRDELLTTVTLYWVTGTINSANRLYFERDRYPRQLGPDQRVDVPCAVTIFPADIDRPPREWAERAYNLRRWTEMPRGGHFAAFEEPELLAEDIRAFFRKLRG